MFLSKERLGNMSKKKKSIENMTIEEMVEIVDRNCKIANVCSNIAIFINILNIGVLILAHLDEIVSLLH
jgi:hypothetical protein